MGDDDILPKNEDEDDIEFLKRNIEKLAQEKENLENQLTEATIARDQRVTQLVDANKTIEDLKTKIEQEKKKNKDYVFVECN